MRKKVVAHVMHVIIELSVTVVFIILLSEFT